MINLNFYLFISLDMTTTPIYLLQPKNNFGFKVKIWVNFIYTFIYPMNTFSSLLAVSLVSYGLVAVPTASTKSQEARQSLVPLGASITFGFNLGNHE
jgi:hypothetical protein